MKHFKNINLWKETKLVNLQANEAELWEEPTPVDTGTAAAEQIIKDFDVRTDPEALSINHPDEVIFGVRSSMMQGPFRGTGTNILSANELHNERIVNRLRNVYSNAPETYRHIIDEEYRRRADAQTWTRPWNRMKFALSSKESIEEKIAKDFFTFNFGRGDTYDSFRDDIYQQIRNLDDPKNGSFLDANNEPINLVDQNATNEYVVATGAASSFRNERVVVKWHDDDYIQIKSKLEKAKLWGEFSRSTPQNRKVREFIHLKFRLSLLDKVAAEEKTKLNNDRFNTQRLKGWLDDDKTTQALHDPEMETFITDNSIRTYGTFENLKNTNPDLHREFENKVDELRKKNEERTLEHYLSRILPPEELAHIHDSLEARTMLAYLQGAAQDPEQGIHIRNYLKKLAGISDEAGKKEGQEEYDEALKEYQEKKNKYDEAAKDKKDYEDDANTFQKGKRTHEYELTELTEEKDLINYFVSTYQGEFAKYSKLKSDLQDNERTLSTTLAGRGNVNQKWRNKIEKEINKQKSDLEALTIQLVQKIKDFIILLNEKLGNKDYDVINNISSSHGKITQNATLKTNPALDFDNYFNNFNEYLFKMDFLIGLKKVKKQLTLQHISLEDKRSDEEEALKTRKEDVDKPKDEIGKMKDDLEKEKKELDKQKEELDKLLEIGYKKSEPKQMDSRNLLTALIKLDLKRHGVTEPETQNKHALFATNLAIARLENSEIYANANQHLVDDYEASGSKRTKDSLSATRFFTPVLSAKDAIEHVVDTDPDLLMFSEITHASTRNDLRKVIDKYNVGPAKLKEFIAKLALCVKGIEISPAGTSLFSKLPYKLGRLFGFSMEGKTKSLGVRLLSHEVPLVENLINTLTLLSAEYLTKNYYKEAKEQAEMDPSKSFDEHYLDMIRQQTLDMRELNLAIAEDLARPDHPMKTHLDFYRMRDKAYEALDQVKHIKDPEEYRKALIRQGVTPRELTRGMISLRTRRFFKKAARVGLTGLSLPFYIPYGVGLGAEAIGKYWWKEIFMTEGTKKGGKMIRENLKAAWETPNHIIGIPLFAASMIFSWPTKQFRKINNKLKE